MTTAVNETGIEIGVTVTAELTAALNRVANELTLKRERETRLAQDIHPVVITGVPIILSGGAGQLGFLQSMSPAIGQYWDIHRIAAWGFSAGTVTGYLDSQYGDLLVPFAQAAVLTFGKGQMMLRGGEHIHWVAQSITGTVTIAMAATEIAAPLIGDYLI